MYRIYYRCYYKGEFTGTGVSVSEYKTVGHAKASARNYFYDRGDVHYEWVVATENPFQESPKSSRSKKGRKDS